jgi:hypothetical protein
LPGPTPRRSGLRRARRGTGSESSRKHRERPTSRSPGQPAGTSMAGQRCIRCRYGGVPGPHPLPSPNTGHAGAVSCLSPRGDLRTGPILPLPFAGRPPQTLR